MSTFWTGVIILVLALELVRIAISTGVLLYVLRGLARQWANEERQPATKPSAVRHHQHEVLRPAVLDAVRGAMDEVATDRADQEVDRAIVELDRYMQTLVEERSSV